MGRRMAANLAAAGFPLVVRDSDDGAQQRFVAGHGGEPATSPASFADAGVVVTMLPDSGAVREADPRLGGRDRRPRSSRGRSCST
jgi:3-hydroxyisobutyrate dehydrogenase-like beta-hydroxyacid dehydrogenase